MDRRHDVDSPDEMFGAICDHIKYATNDGNIKPTVTIFRQRQFQKPDLRVWSGFGLSYAGYEIEDESRIDDKEAYATVPEAKKTIKIGDQINLEFTQVSNYNFICKLSSTNPIYFIT